MKTTRKILVLGGSGVTGRRIAARLLLLHGGSSCEIWLASRHERERSASEGVLGGRRIDVLAADAPRQIAGHDLAIIALGPFDKFGTRAHRACLEAGVDCLDVNDAPDQVPALLALDASARAKGVRVATGMGLCPGLTTVLLLDFLRSFEPAPADVEIALFLGGDQPVGRASIETMLSGFSPQVWALCDGVPVRVMAADDTPRTVLAFPGRDCAVPAYHLPLAEAFTLARAIDPLPRTLELRAHFEGLSRPLVRFLRSRIGHARPIQRALAALMAVLQPQLRRRQKLQEESLVWIYDRAAPDTRAIVASGLGSYDLTARFAARVALGLLNGALSLPPGVHSAESLASHRLALLSALGEDGVRITRAGVLRERAVELAPELCP